MAVGALKEEKLKKFMERVFDSAYKLHPSLGVFLTMNSVGKL